MKKAHASGSFRGLKLARTRATAAVRCLLPLFQYDVRFCICAQVWAEDSSCHSDALKEGTTLLQAAPADLKNNENLFENIFFFERCSEPLGREGSPNLGENEVSPGK